MNFKKLITVLAILTSTSVNAASGNSISCPATVRAGTPLAVNVTLSNSDCNNGIDISKLAFSLMGNIDGQSLGLLGPYVLDLPLANVVSPAICSRVSFDPLHPEYGSYLQITPTSQTFNDVPIISNIPAGMAGTLALATAMLVNQNNKTHMIGSCTVSVTN